MVVALRIATLRTRIQLGHRAFTRTNFNVATGVEKIHVIVSASPEGSHPCGGPRKQGAALAMLEYLLNAAHQDSIVDRGHRHSNGDWDVTFHVRHSNVVWRVMGLWRVTSTRTSWLATLL